MIAMSREAILMFQQILSLTLDLFRTILNDILQWSRCLDIRILCKTVGSGINKSLPSDLEEDIGEGTHLHMMYYS